MIKAIIFDIGGVVINDDFLSYAKRFEKKAGMSKERIYRSVIGSPEWRLYFKGKVSGEEVWKAIKRKYLPPSIADEIRSSWEGIFSPITGTINIIKHLKQTYKIFFLSNVDRKSATFVNKKYPEIFRLFDDGVMSFQTGMAKPDKRIYRYALRKFRLKPGECIYIDNQPENIPPARKLGMKAIRFQGTGRLKQQLKLFGVKF